MRVGFDVSALEPPCSPGVRRVARSLLEALEARAPESGLEVVRLAPPAGTSAATWRQRALPGAVRASGLVGLHSFTSSFPLRGPGRRVQTVHELPWRHGEPENAGPRHRLWVALGALRADRIVCPTAHVAADLARGFLGARAGTRTRVVPWGVDATFAEEPPAGTVDEVVLERYRLGGDPFVLVPGGVRAKKNLAALLEGVAALGKGGGPRLHVVVTGGDTLDHRRDLGLASRLGLAGQVTTLDEVEEADLAALYRLATVVPVLARSEGFGLPALEALASGTPVLVPAGTAQAEVAGAAGLVVEPERAESVAAGLRTALEERERLRLTLPDAAHGRTWARAAEAIETLWRELAR
jgi:alpha-1,3-rhamnosyl/mannosyltransferase